MFEHNEPEGEAFRPSGESEGEAVRPNEGEPSQPASEPRYDAAQPSGEPEDKIIPPENEPELKEEQGPEENKNTVFPIPPVEPPRPQKERRTFGLSTVLALVLCCTIFGGIAGGIVSYYMSNSGQTAKLPVLTQSDARATSAADEKSGLTKAQIYEKCNPSVVAISTESTMYNVFGQAANSASAGSGFIISSDGYIVTNAHVIDNASSIQVVLSDGTKYAAKIIGKDTDSDLALLKAEAKNLAPVTLGNSDNLAVGDSVVAIGNPLGELANSMTSGIISALDRQINIDGTPMNMLQIDAAISPGNSGGPLFDMNGNVIGVTSAKSVMSGVEGIGFAIPINDVKKVIEPLTQYGYIAGKPQLGVQVQNANAVPSTNRNIAGVYVAVVEQNSCAAKAGMKPGDIITALDKYEIKSVNDLVSALKHFSAGNTVSITINRGGQTSKLNVTLDEKPRSVA